RLHALLSRNPPDAEWRAHAEKLCGALIAAKQPEDALRFVGDPRLINIPAAKFWRAGALASLGRPAEALSLYQEAAAQENSPFRAATLFGEAEMLRALNRPEDALQKFSSLFRDPDYGTRAQLRATELYLDQSDSANARGLLHKIQPKSATDKKEKRFLRGRLEMVLHRPERAVRTFETIVKKTSGATHSLVLGSLFRIATT